MKDTNKVSVLMVIAAFLLLAWLLAGLPGL